MAFSEKQKSAILDKAFALCSERNYTALFPEVQANEYFRDDVRDEVRNIVAHNLNDNITNWGVRCQEQRNERHLTLEGISATFSISHSALTAQEHKNKPFKVDEFYLTFFSLIYQVNPRTLLGIPLTYGVPSVPFCPMEALDSFADKCINLVMGMLYTPDNPQNLDYLQCLFQLASLHTQDAVVFINQISVFIPVKVLQNLDIEAQDIPPCNMWRTLLNKRFSKEAFRQLPKIDQDNLILLHNSYLAFENLRMSHSESLQLIAQFALANDDQRLFISSLIKNHHFFQTNYKRINFHGKKDLILQD